MQNTYRKLSKSNYETKKNLKIPLEIYNESISAFHVNTAIINIINNQMYRRICKTN